MIQVLQNEKEIKQVHVPKRPKLTLKKKLADINLFEQSVALG